MDFAYFLVTGSKAWEAHYHENFFNVHGGFLWGGLAALIIAAIFACIFYFVCCGSKKSRKMANITVWTVFLLISGVIGYFYADLVVIGDAAAKDNKGIFREHSFYKAMDDYYIEQSQKPGISTTELHQLAALKNQIRTNLNKDGDIRFEYDITTGILAILFFILISILIKRFSPQGKTIPIQNP